MAWWDKSVTKLARGMDVIAQWAMVTMMALAVVNIALRLFRRPILGTYEFISFLAAVAISFTLAYCAIQRGHIAVTMFVERLKPQSRATVDIIVNLIGVIFFAFTAWQLGLYATDMVVSGEVSPTTQTPFFPFVYGVAFSFLTLCLVLLVDLFHAVARVRTK